MKISADRTHLQTLLGVPDQQLRIPPYQRPYAWQAEQVDELWSDLTQTLGSGHFMGSIVLNCEVPESPEVIDGQQRLTTLLLLLALIRDEYVHLDAQRVGYVQQFLETLHPDDEERRFKFRVGEANWQVFKDFVLRAPASPGRKGWAEGEKLSSAERHRNAALLRNAERLQGHLHQRLAGRAGPTERLAELRKLEEAIVKKLEFVVIRVQQVSDAFAIFETLNDRGLALSAGDLLKNHLLMHADKAGLSVEELAECWDRLLASLEGADITRFLRHYLLIRHQRVTKEGIFVLFKKEVSSQGVSTLMADLLEMGQLYGQFVEPRNVSHAGVRAVLEDLHTLKATLCYSSLLSARRHLSDEDFISFARLAEVLTFRYSTICSKDSKELEVFYHRSAKLLAESQGKDLKAARKVLLDAMPSSEEFTTAFLQQSMGQKYVVDYLLRRIESHLDDEKKTREPGSIHIEHIMPQHLSTEWRGALGSHQAEHGDYVNRWGNLTLLGGKKNVVASDGLFEKKRTIYKDSQIRLTQELATLDGWNLEAIESRQQRLALLADTVWRPS
ncbi:DUF262 domain-containing protein [Myxococcus sp. AS-1-15]|uniref:DUF262 domain-containing protein n=1 Tax=Myxococcus sp. AS-1-15 TaxID=2874600 RepID=UPI001CC11450|nr:DUF262 domain-containing protein [Myxococcus sp. AS-1-15]MBZ4402224.1 DUF262 domain-containing HNH endonuclease family protein [Myxococcus sp. AS-1-15]